MPRCEYGILRAISGRVVAGGKGRRKTWASSGKVRSVLKCEQQGVFNGGVNRERKLGQLKY